MTESEIVYILYKRGALVLMAIGLANLAMTLTSWMMFFTGGLAFAAFAAAFKFFPYPDTVKTLQDRLTVTKKHKYSPWAWVLILALPALTAWFCFKQGVSLDKVVHYIMAVMMFAMAGCSLVYCRQLKAKMNWG